MGPIGEHCGVKVNVPALGILDRRPRDHTADDTSTLAPPSGDRQGSASVIEVDPSPRGRCRRKARFDRRARRPLGRCVPLLGCTTAALVLPAARRRCA